MLGRGHIGDDLTCLDFTRKHVEPHENADYSTENRGTLKKTSTCFQRLTTCGSKERLINLLQIRAHNLVNWVSGSLGMYRQSSTAHFHRNIADRLWKADAKWGTEESSMKETAVCFAQNSEKDLRLRPFSYQDLDSNLYKFWPLSKQKLRHSHI